MEGPPESPLQYYSRGEIIPVLRGNGNGPANPATGRAFKV